MSEDDDDITCYEDFRKVFDSLSSDEKSQMEKAIPVSLHNVFGYNMYMLMLFCMRSLAKVCIEQNRKLCVSYKGDKGLLVMRAEVCGPDDIQYRDDSNEEDGEEWKSNPNI